MNKLSKDELIYNITVIVTTILIILGIILAIIRA